MAIGRQSSAVHRDHRPVLAGAETGDGVGDHSLTRPGLAKNQDGCICGGYLLGPEEDIVEGVAASLNLLETLHPPDLFLEIQVLVFKAFTERFNFPKALQELILHSFAFKRVGEYLRDQLKLPDNLLRPCAFLPRAIKSKGANGRLAPH